MSIFIIASHKLQLKFIHKIIDERKYNVFFYIFIG